MDPKYKKTRFVCVSDTHGHTPGEAGFRLPVGDVLIHAGDLTNQGSKSELQKTMNWIRNADFEVKIVVAGNHDITLDREFYAVNGTQFHNQHPEEVDECINIVQDASPSVVYLNHTNKTIRLVKPGGPRTTFKIFGSPFSRFHGNWAFGYNVSESESIWNGIPADVDIIVTHTPPYSHCDSSRGSLNTTSEASREMPFGCKGLLKTLRRTRPLLAVCGHIHEGRGFERVRWGNAPAYAPSNERTVNALSPLENENLVDERAELGSLPPLGSKKQHLVDLTGKTHRMLNNTSFSTAPYPQVDIGGQTVGSEGDIDDLGKYLLRRKETCIVNAAIIATSWPHRGGKRFNPPIVVDLDLPVSVD